MKQAQRKSLLDWYKCNNVSLFVSIILVRRVLLGTALILGIATIVHSVQAEEKIQQ